MSTLVKIGLAGNPNTGKSSLFNKLTGSHQSVGNWSGVTVEKKTGFYRYLGTKFSVVDLPGTYSIESNNDNISKDEIIAKSYIVEAEIDIIVNVIDASNIERNLYLTTQLLDLGKPIIIVLNMMDMLKKKGIKIDAKHLADILKCNVVELVVIKDRGIKELKRVIVDQLKFIDGFDNFCRTYDGMGDSLKKSVNKIVLAIKDSFEDEDSNLYSIGLNLLEYDESNRDKLSELQLNLINQERLNLERSYGEDIDIILADARYEYITNITRQVKNTTTKLSKSLTQKIDKVVLNRVLGFPIFLCVMYLLFFCTIKMGNVFVDFFDQITGVILVDGSRYLLMHYNAPELLIAIVSDGLATGVQTVSTFIPIIGCLYFFLSLLEDSGYMARAAFVIDRFMSWLGLHGKSFVSLLIGFGCNVPSIMSARTLSSEKDRLLTIIMAPFMSCGARLPVYTLFTLIFFEENAENIVFLLYLTGVAVAVLTALIMKYTLLPGGKSMFCIELPDYHMPLIGNILCKVRERLNSFVFGAGKVIVLMVLVLGLLNSIGMDGTFNNQNTQNSILSTVAKKITPLFSPIGISENNWPAVVGIFTGVFAKEAIVGTLVALYGEEVENDSNGEFNFGGKIQDAFRTIKENTYELVPFLNIEMDSKEIDSVRDSAIKKAFVSTSAVIAYLLFILLYTPCVAVLAVIYRETNIKWTVFIGTWTLFTGFFFSIVYYQSTRLISNPGEAIGWLFFMFTLLIFIIGMLRRGNIKKTLHDTNLLYSKNSVCAKC